MAACSHDAGEQDVSVYVDHAMHSHGEMVLTVLRTADDKGSPIAVVDVFVDRAFVT